MTPNRIVGAAEEEEVVSFVRQTILLTLLSLNEAHFADALGSFKN